ncbi:MAG: uncharacterized protein PWQ60_1879 [Thermoanaerobacteraceae bacterium]|jgi:TRAP transporter TAXI family solute receptor|nr:uncharacterized protein [Thermoanaerobacteraceae bacterium]RKL63813.1 hypothetical protein DXT63_04950 [Thermoanaerobacteraceae bacterium SP2]
MTKSKGFKGLALLIAILLTFGMVGCSSQSKSSNDGNTQQGNNVSGDKPLNFRLIGATIGGGGVWDLIATGIAETIMQKLPGSTITSVPGEGVANVESVHNGEAELGLTHSSIAASAVLGIDPFSEKIEDVKAIASLYGSGLQFITRKEFAANSIKEIIDKKMKIKLAVGNPGSTGELATMRMLQEYGVTYKDIESWGGKIYFKDMGEAADMLGDGLIDAFTLLTIAPAGPVQEVSSTHEVKMLPVEEDIVNSLIKKYGYTDFTISKDAYNFLGDNIKTFGSQVILITHNNVAEEDIYRITKALVENLDYLHTVHANLKNLSAESMAKGTGAALHPGAERYYLEIGVLK